MVLLLNIMVPVLILLAAWVSWKKKNWKPVVIVAVLGVAYSLWVQPGYGPRNQIERSRLPSFEQSKEEIQNRQLSPKSGEERDSEMEQKIKEGLIFLER